ncbi:hypothetical protein BH11PSE2_BH11PSE2_19750 [soil metagenome]
MFGYSLTLIAIDATIVGVLLFATIKGGPAERRAALLYFAVLLISIPLGAPRAQSVHDTLNLVLDAIVAIGFLLLSVRYSNLWLAAAMVTQGLLFGVHAYRLGLEENLIWHHLNVAVLFSNIMAMQLMWIFTGATIASWVRRSRLARGAKATTNKSALRWQPAS